MSSMIGLVVCRGSTRGEAENDMSQVPYSWERKGKEGTNNVKGETKQASCLPEDPHSKLPLEIRDPPKISPSRPPDFN
jgi:hypothetical protein